MKKTLLRSLCLFLVFSFLFGSVVFNVLADTYSLPGETNDSNYFYVFTARELTLRNSLPLRAHAFLLNVPKGGTRTLEQSVTTTAEIQFTSSTSSSVSFNISESVGASASSSSSTTTKYSVSFTTKQGWTYSFPSEYNGTTYNSCDFYTAVGYDRYTYTVELYQAIHWTKSYWLFGWHQYDEGYDKGSYLYTTYIPVDLPKDVCFCAPDNYSYLKSTGSVTPAYLGGDIIDGSKYVTKPENLKGIWKFEGNTTDLSGHANGTLINGSYTQGKIGQAISLNGSNAYVSINPASFNNMSAYTLSAWIYPTGIGYYGSPIISKVDPNRDFVFQLDSNRRLNFHVAHGSTYYQCTSDSQLPLNTWTHVAAVWSGGTIKLYINGALVKQITYSGLTPDWTGTIMGIGTMDKVMFFSGAIDEVKIFAKALTDGEVWNEYSLGVN